MNTSPFAEAIAAQETAREGWMTPKFQRTTDAAFTVTTMCEGLRVCHENFAQALEQESNDKDAEIDRLKKELGEKMVALEACSQFQYSICGAAMAIAHGEPEQNVWTCIDEMGPLMDQTKRP